MRSKVFFKAGIGCFGLLLLGVIALVCYVIYRKHAYANMPDTHDLKQRINTLVANYTAKRPNGALTVGIVQRGTNYVSGWGQVSATNTAKPDGETVYEIGSVTKVFTGLVLAEMLHDGAVKLEDPISKFLPSNVTSPKDDDVEIVLGHLVTHTAGLPRLPDDMMAAAKDKLNPYADYHPTNLYQTLDTVKLKPAPGKKPYYSNLGFALLGHVLSLKAGKTYDSLVQEGVCGPLGLSNTVIHLSPDQQARLTPGHDSQGNVVPNWDFDVMAPAGALKSTANDLLKFLSANLKPDDSRIGRALAEAQKIHYKEYTGGIGLAWQVISPVEGQTWHWHNGGTGGYVSFVGFDRANQVGVVVLSNYGDAMAGDNDLDRLSVEILRLAAKISLE